MWKSRQSEPANTREEFVWLQFIAYASVSFMVNVTILLPSEETIEKPILDDWHRTLLALRQRSVSVSKACPGGQE